MVQVQANNGLKAFSNNRVGSLLAGESTKVERTRCLVVGNETEFTYLRAGVRQSSIGSSPTGATSACSVASIP